MIDSAFLQRVTSSKIPVNLYPSFIGWLAKLLEV